MFRPLAFASLTALSGALVYGVYLAMAGAAAVAVPACSTDDGSTGITPITGIVVRSESLTAGHGCGTQPGQVFKYVAVVTQAPTASAADAGDAATSATAVDASDASASDADAGDAGAAGADAGDAEPADAGADAAFTGLAAPGAPVAEGAFDCFADGTFANLPASSTGSTAYEVFVYAFDAKTWDAEQSIITCAAIPGPTNAPVSLPGNCAGVNAAPFGGGGSASFDQVLTSLATWRTTCTATQESDIEVLAVCDPLSVVSH